MVKISRGRIYFGALSSVILGEVNVKIPNGDMWKSEKFHIISTHVPLLLSFADRESMSI